MCAQAHIGYLVVFLIKEILPKQVITQLKKKLTQFVAAKGKE